MRINKVLLNISMIIDIFLFVYLVYDSTWFLTRPVGYMNSFNKFDSL
jgi:hypothetical protein